MPPHQRQQKLFDLAPAPWEADDAQVLRVARVAFVAGPAQSFDYHVPDRLADQVAPGKRVRAPLGRANRLAVAYCLRVETRREGRPLKPLSGVIDQTPLLSPSMLRLVEWIADRYLCSLGQTLEAVLPAGVRSQAGTRAETFFTASAEATAQAGQWKLPAKQAAVLRCLVAAERPLTVRQLAQLAGCTAGPIHALRDKGLLVSAERRVATGAAALGEELVRDAELTLHADQQRALDAIVAAMEARRHATVLVHGVTGSGKTEVYLQAIGQVVRYGRQAIVLVPEISLTPQTEERFRRRFGRVAVLHSHQSDVERHRHWQQIAAGRVAVVVGARSAVFAPTPHLGLIVIDEEHESSFKQDSAPRYHARDVALERARAENVPLVLGSATPALETWHAAARGEYELVSLPVRVSGRPLPAVQVVDLRAEFVDRRARGAISRQLIAAMDQALRADGQVILLLNRRGYSTHIQCPACGQVVRCPHCEIALTHHLSQQVALCHYCDYSTPPPAQCPHCQFEGIRYSGQGTQRLEAEVRARFPHYPCLRMDTDSMQRPGSHARALAAFQAGQVRILLGTQMIAKGLDFPNVTLVGVINADTALHLPDFRAAERTFQLVTQVAGRTGRGPKGGRVLVQTFSPEHPAIQAAARHDYARFATHELPFREALGYPPYASLLRVVVRGPAERAAQAFAEQFAESLQGAIAQLGAVARVLGPAPCPITRLRGLYRFQLQLQGPDSAALRAAARQVTARLQPPDEIEWIVDVDPLDML